MSAAKKKATVETCRIMIELELPKSEWNTGTGIDSDFLLGLAEEACIRTLEDTNFKATKIGIEWPAGSPQVYCHQGREVSVAKTLKAKKAGA